MRGHLLDRLALALSQCAWRAQASAGRLISILAGLALCAQLGFAAQPTGFINEPARDFRANAGQLTRYWCQEIWATRGWPVDADLDPTLADATLSLEHPPSRQGLGRIELYWRAQAARHEGLVKGAFADSTASLSEWTTLKASHAALLERIAQIEAKVGKCSAELARHDNALAAIGPAVGLLQGYASAKRKLDEAYTRATGLTNLSSRDPATGLRAPEILQEQSRIDNEIRSLRATLIANELVDVAATTAQAMVAGLLASNAFHEQERARVVRDSGLTGNEADELVQLRAQRDALAQQMRTAADQAERALTELSKLELEQSHFLLSWAMIKSCLDDQARHLGGPPGVSGPPQVSLPGGEVVADPGRIITGFFKQVCGMPNSRDPADQRIDFQTGSMVLEFVEGNRFRVQLRSPSRDGNARHDDQITAEGDWDPLTGQGTGVGDLERLLPADQRLHLIRVSVYVENKNGSTRVNGLYCNGPDAARMDQVVSALGGSTYLSYCGGKFWGPEDSLEPSGAERDSQCGF